MIKQKATLLIVKYPFLRWSWKYFTVLGTIDLPFCKNLGGIFSKFDNNRTKKIGFYDSDLCRFGAA